MSKNKYEKIDEKISKQTQTNQPGKEADMNPEPIYDDVNYIGSDKLLGKNALITGGDSGIGRAVAIAFAKEGANIVIAYLSEKEDEDANKTLDLIENYAVQLVHETIEKLGSINILINNAGKQFPQTDLLDISTEQLEETFETNFYGLFQVTKAALKHMENGDVIVNTSSITAYKGSPGLMDYVATKGAITSFTRSLALNLSDKGVRVNAVAPGPIWTPLIPATFDGEKVAEHGDDTPLTRRGQPAENAPAYVFLASNDSSYLTGQTIHVNGGDFVSS